MMSAPGEFAQLNKREGRMRKIHKVLFNWGAANVCGIGSSFARYASSPHWANVTCKNCLKRKEK